MPNRPYTLLLSCMRLACLLEVSGSNFCQSTNSTGGGFTWGPKWHSESMFR
jgi:hypothetical protein